jgi:hypothetical protein
VKWLRRDAPETDGQSGRSNPPPPDTTVPFRHTSQEAVETVYSRSQKYRVVLARDERGLFRIHSERWDTDDWDVGGSPHWCPHNRGVSITDTLENARKLAGEKLALVEPPQPEGGDVDMRCSGRGTARMEPRR